MDNKTDDISLLRQLAALMGWTIYGDAVYDDWLGRIERKQAADTCHIDSAGLVWRYERRLVEWRPLSSMDDAMMLLWRLRELGCGTMMVCLPDDAQPTVTIWLSSPDANGNYTPDAHGNFARTAYADTPQRAICLAALRAAETREER